jgi:tetratricopeptide (TPR) repeat protein
MQIAFQKHRSHRLLTLVVLFLSFTSVGRTDAIDWTKVHNLTARGIHLLYSLELEGAIQAFDSVSQIAPGDPRGPFFHSMVHFYLYTLNRDEQDLNRFFSESERVIKVCDDLLDQNDNDATTKFYLGGIYGYRGLAYQTSGSILKAAQNGREGYLLLEDAVRLNPKLYDAQMGFGLFRYLLAKLPKSMRWILHLLGFEGDLEGGLRSLQLAAEKGTYTRTEAKLFLSQFLFSEGREDTAMQYLNQLRTEYPGNTLFLVLYAFWQHRLNNLDEAMSAAKNAIELNKKNNVRYGEELAYSTLGSVYFTRNEFTRAKENYQLYLQMTKNLERTPNWTMYRAGVACEIAGDRELALQFYRRMKEVDDPDRAWDMYYYRRGQQLVRTPITKAQTLLTRADNVDRQKKTTEAINLYRQALSASGSDIDAQARAMYGLQQTQMDADSLTSALDTSQKLIRMEPVNEKWILPHAWFGLGEIYAKLGRIDEAREAFDQVEEYDDYDFQARLERRLERERTKIAEAN